MVPSFERLSIYQGSVNISRRRIARWGGGALFLTLQPCHNYVICLHAETSRHEDAQRMSNRPRVVRVPSIPTGTRSALDCFAFALDVFLVRCAPAVDKLLDGIDAGDSSP
jgi:hypothetical protein